MIIRSIGGNNYIDIPQNIIIDINNGIHIPPSLSFVQIDRILKGINGNFYIDAVNIDFDILKKDSDVCEYFYSRSYENYNCEWFFFIRVKNNNELSKIKLLGVW